jgi:HPt (histidine-containing phosphotransfer) domain-containing protein
MVSESYLQNTSADDDSSPRPANERCFDDVMDLESLYERCMGNLDLMERVLDKFEKRLPEELAELERLLDGGDAATIAQMAHRIKGNCSNVSAAGLRRAAEDIEELCHAGGVADTTYLTNLREQWRRYMDCRVALRSMAAGQFKPGPQAGV